MYHNWLRSFHAVAKEGGFTAASKVLNIGQPTISDQVKALEGEEIEVRGYVIPVEGYKSHTEFIFSAFPYNMCFFCGGAGPETVMEVYANEAIQYQTESITIRGTLELNDSDINKLMYILRDVTLVEE